MYFKQIPKSKGFLIICSSKISQIPPIHADLCHCSQSLPNGKAACAARVKTVALSCYEES